MSVAENSLNFAWLEVTGLCDEFCTHCYADPSPKGTHGTMTAQDRLRVISELNEMRVPEVQVHRRRADARPRKQWSRADDR
ncbi:hypothetical protein ACIRBZ_20160 [Streptomyces sp. NPDC094038]|uniref:hypothetical protein n=1 Tax=Streptomyces sp. NPDC094038 TaxID=3366055 RepID=UPI003804E2FD